MLELLSGRACIIPAIKSPSLSLVVNKTGKNAAGLSGNHKPISPSVQQTCGGKFRVTVTKVFH